MSEDRLPPNKAQLRRQLRALAKDFADRVIDVLDEEGVFEERSGDWSAQPPRIRRSPEALAALCERLLKALAASEQAVAISELAGQVGLKTREIAHPLSLLTEQGKVLRSGERRGARYSLASEKKSREKRRKRRS